MDVMDGMMATPGGMMVTPGGLPTASTTQMQFTASSPVAVTSMGRVASVTMPMSSPATITPAITSIPTQVATVKSEPMKIAAPITPNTASQASTLPQATPTLNVRPATAVSTGESKVLDKRRLAELVKEVDPLEQLDEDVEEMLMQIADDFIDNVVTASCQMAKHRKANTVEVKDVQLHLERNWNMWVPGFGSEELRPYKKAATTEAHKQRLALIKKTLKKS